MGLLLLSALTMVTDQAGYYYVPMEFGAVTAIGIGLISAARIAVSLSRKLKRAC
jgi:hypothetical protein